MLLPPSLFVTGQTMTNFGFQQNKSAIIQFVNAIGVKRKSKKGTEILQFLRDVTAKHLDIRITTRPQSASLTLIENELFNKFPEVFDQVDKEKRLYMAIRAVVQLHAGARKQKGQAIQRKKKGKKPATDVAPPNGEVLDLTLDDSALEISSLPDISTSGSSSTTPCSVKKEREQERNHASSSKYEMEVKRELPRNLLQTPQPALHDHHSDHETAFVREFLRTCKPSMEHVLRRFLDFGCLNREYIQSLSTWPYEKRYQVLKRLLAGKPESLQAVREMDLIVLENQFQEFFL